MRGYINGIWLTQRDGKLHPAIVPNLESWVTDAASCDFGVVLWTNINDIAPEEIDSLKSRNIIVKDHSLCESSPLYKYFIFFLKKGINGDKTAFALASDILRMAILDLADDNEYYIYADPNDVKFVGLKASLEKIPKRIASIKFGFSFYVEQIPGHPNIFHRRNDVLIAHKIVNRNFFRDYLAAYLKHVAEKHSIYVKPTTDSQAQKLANTISNQTGNDFFCVVLTRPFATVRATFGNYKALYPIVNCLVHLRHERSIEYANTWLPQGELIEQNQQLRLLGLKPIVNHKPMMLSGGITVKPIAKMSELMAKAESIGISAGENKPPVATSFNELYLQGMELYKAKEYTEALNLFQQSLSQHEESDVAKIKNSNDIATLKYNIGSIYMIQGLHTEAFVYLQAAYKIRLELLGFDHEKTLKAQRKIQECATEIDKRSSASAYKLR